MKLPRNCKNPQFSPCSLIRLPSSWIQLCPIKLLDRGPPFELSKQTNQPTRLMCAGQVIREELFPPAFYKLYVQFHRRCARGGVVVAVELPLVRISLFGVGTASAMAETTELKVAMSCQGCVGAVKRAIGKLEGVESYDIDIEKQKVTVVGNLKPEVVLDRISKTGKKTSFWTEESAPKTDSPGVPEAVAVL